MSAVHSDALIQLTCTNRPYKTNHQISFGYTKHAMGEIRNLFSILQENWDYFSNLPTLCRKSGIVFDIFLHCAGKFGIMMLIVLHSARNLVVLLYYNYFYKI